MQLPTKNTTWLSNNLPMVNLKESSQIIQTHLRSAPWHLNLKSLNEEIKQQVTLKEKNRNRKKASEKLTSVTPTLNESINPIKIETPKTSSLNDQESQLANLKREKQLISLIELAQSQFELKETEKATSTINKGLLINPKNEELLLLKDKIQTQQNTQIKLTKIISESQEMFQNGKLKDSMTLIEKGLALNSSQSDLLALKDKVLVKQNEIKAKKEKDETLSILYARALNSYNKNEIDSAIAFIDKGLSLESSHLKLLGLKAKILVRQNAAKTQKEKDETLANLYTRSLNTFRNNDINGAMALVDEGLSLDSNNLNLLDLKAKIEAKQIAIQTQNEKDETLKTLYARSLASFRNNEIESAMALVNEGLSLSSNNLKLLELKRDIMLKKDELTASEKKNQKVAMMLSLIEEKQRNLDALDNKIVIEQQSLLFKAQQTLENYRSKDITSKSLPGSAKSVKKSTVTPTVIAAKVSTPIDYKVDLGNLPLSIGKHWVLDRDNRVQYAVCNYHTEKYQWLMVMGVRRFI